MSGTTRITLLLACGLLLLAHPAPAPAQGGGQAAKRKRGKKKKAKKKRTRREWMARRVRRQKALRNRMARYRIKKPKEKPAEGLPLDLLGPGPRGFKRAVANHYKGIGHFGAGVTLNAFMAAAEEWDVDMASDALLMPGHVDFYVGLEQFDLANKFGTRVLSPLEARLAQRLPANSKMLRALGTVKGNLVLAGALSFTEAVHLDMNGFTWVDLASGNFTKLQDASLSINKLDRMGLPITLASFAGAGYAWRGGSGKWKGGKGLVRQLARKGILKLVGKKIGGRFLKTFAIKAGLLAAPDPTVSKLATAGMTIYDFGMGALDFAMILRIAEHIQEPVEAFLDPILSASELRSAIQDAADLTHQGEVDPTTFQEALVRVATAFGLQRDLLYMDVAMEDQKLIQRIKQRQEGVEESKVLNYLRLRSLSDYGEPLALAGQSFLLLEEYEMRIREVQAGSEEVQIPGGDLEAFKGLVSRHKDRVKELIQEVQEQPGLPEGELDFTPMLTSNPLKPTSTSSILQDAKDDAEDLPDPESGGAEPTIPVGTNRTDLFEQEKLLYCWLLDQNAIPDTTEGKRLKKLVETQIKLLDNALALEEDLLAETAGLPEEGDTNGSSGSWGREEPLLVTDPILKVEAKAAHRLKTDKATPMGELIHGH